MKDTKKTVGFVGIREAAELSGLPQHFWRKELAAGNIPHLRSGNKFYIDYERALAKLRGDEM